MYPEFIGLVVAFSPRIVFILPELCQFLFEVELDFDHFYVILQITQLVSLTDHGENARLAFVAFVAYHLFV